MHSGAEAVDERGKRGPAVRNPSVGVDPAVRVGPLTHISAVLRELGAEPDAVFDGVELRAAEFTDPDNEIPYLSGSRLLKRCLTATGCEHFGLLVGIRASPSTLGLAGFMLSSAPDVGTALQGLAQNLDLHNQGGVLTVHVEGGVAAFGYAIRQPGARAPDQIYDLAVAVAVACNIMRALCGENWNPTQVLLSRRSPRDLAPYRRFFRAPMHFNAGHSALTFPSRWMNHKLASADPLLDYADVTTFSRAFKRWAGMPPAQWRSHHGASE